MLETQYYDQLAKKDSCLEIILHGSLLQREVFSTAISQILKKHPTAKSDIFFKLVS